jgi:hypothetical protein
LGFSLWEVRRDGRYLSFGQYSALNEDFQIDDVFGNSPSLTMSRVKPLPVPYLPIPFYEMQLQKLQYVSIRSSSVLRGLVGPMAVAFVS